MHKAVDSPLKLRSHPCPLCESLQSNDVELFPARLENQVVSAQVFSARRRPDRLHYRLVRCEHDGLVRSDPVLPIDQLDQLYRESHFTYDSEVALLTKTYVSALQPLLKQLPSNAHLLEIGCGNGFVLQALADRGYTNLHGVEPSKEAVAKAQPALRKKIIQQPFSVDVLPKQSLDAIFMFQTLDHISDINQFIADCYSLLKPGGLFLSYHHDVDFWLVKLLGEAHPIIDVEHTQLFDHRTTKAIVAKHGLVIDQCISPLNYVSLGHTLHLLPIPQKMKTAVLQPREGWLKRLLNLPLTLELGNICVIAHKPQVVVAANTSNLSQRQKQLRRMIVDWSYRQKLSHLGSCLTAIDIVAAVYDIKRTTDLVVLSSGHAALALYAVLVEKKVLPKSVVPKLAIHPDRNKRYHITVSTGSLGQGLPIAVGQALANQKQRVFCITSDGEWSEGSMFEALRVAVDQNINNLTIIVNCNGWAAYRPTSISQLKKQLMSFGADVIDVDGHNLPRLQSTLKVPVSHGLQIVLAQTDVEQLPCLVGQAAHYHVMTPNDYQAALECLQ